MIEQVKIPAVCIGAVEMSTYLGFTGIVEAWALYTPPTPPTDWSIDSAIQQLGSCGSAIGSVTDFGEVVVLNGDSPLIIGYSTLQVKNRAGEYLGLGIIFQDLTFVKKKA